MKRIILIIVISLFIRSLEGQDKFSDPRDGTVYHTITVEGVTWMAENLKFRITGEGSDCFDNDPNNISGYGILYSWETAMNVCPTGWHLPSGSEFRNLLDHYEKDESWKKSSTEPGAFDIQLAGMKDFEGTFTEMDESGYYWTSTEYNKEEAEYFSYMILGDRPVIDISRKEDAQDIHGSEKVNKYSVRCVKNHTSEPIAHK